MTDRVYAKSSRLLKKEDYRTASRHLIFAKRTDVCGACHLDALDTVKVKHRVCQTYVELLSLRSQE